MQNLKTVSQHTACRWQLFSVDRDNITQRSQMELSGKQKTFFQFFSSFLKSSLTLEHIQNKDDPHSECVSEIMDSQKHSQINP